MAGTASSGTLASHTVTVTAHQLAHAATSVCATGPRRSHVLAACAAIVQVTVLGIPPGTGNAWSVTCCVVGAHTVTVAVRFVVPRSSGMPGTTRTIPVPTL